MPVDQGPIDRARAALADGDLDTAITELETADPVPFAEMRDEDLPRRRMTELERTRIASALQIPQEKFDAEEEAAWAETVRRGLIDPETMCPKCGFEKTSAHCGRCGFITNGPEPALPTWGCFRTVPPNTVRHGPHDWTGADDAHTRYHCDGAA